MLRSARCGTAAATARHRTPLHCVARRTKSGGGERERTAASSSSRSSSGRSSGAGRNSSPASTVSGRSSRSPSPAPPRSASSGAARGSNSGRPQRGGAGSGMSELEALMRRTPGLNRFLDGTLILGDAVMVLATEASSERLPLDSMPALAGVAVAAWIAAGALLGDYSKTPDPDANPLSDAVGWPIVQAVVSAMVTWAVALVASIAGFSWLVSQYLVDPVVVLEVPHDGELSPQIEVSVALLVTMACWRGTAARLRM